MKIVVTGALGHIGSKLIRELSISFENLEIHMIDNLLTQRYTSLFNLPQNIKYYFYELDITKDNLDQIFESADYVIHLAALTVATSSFDNPDEYELINYMGTKRILEMCNKVSAKLIHFSSTSIYGTKKTLVDDYSGTEDINPQSPYAETKYREELLVQKYFNNNLVDTITLRMGSICGISHGMRFHAAISKFCYQASLGMPLTVWKTALNQKRPYLNIYDATNAIAYVIKNNLFNGSIFNLVTSNYTVKQIIDEIRIYINDAKINLVESNIMNEYSYDVYPKKIIDQGFEFSKSIRPGIKDTLNLFKPINK